MKSKIVLKELKKLYKHLTYYNWLAPFPVYDTDYVKDVDNKIKEIMENNKKDYDEEPVVACKYCKSLHIETDELNNDVCMKCGSINELQTFKNIFDYKKFKEES
jgi:hypothetical protein